MVDVLQAWEDVATPEKHSQHTLDYLSQQGYNQGSTQMGAHTLQSTEPPRSASTEQQGGVG